MDLLQNYRLYARNYIVLHFGERRVRRCKILNAILQEFPDANWNTASAAATRLDRYFDDIEWLPGGFYRYTPTPLSPELEKAVDKVLAGLTQDGDVGASTAVKQPRLRLIRSPSNPVGERVVLSVLAKEVFRKLKVAPQSIDELARSTGHAAAVIKAALAELQDSGVAENVGPRWRAT